jgi:hypothetical protein
MLEEAYRRYTEKGNSEQTHLPGHPSLVDPVNPIAHDTTLRRVVHTNGIHYIKLWTCDCKGPSDMIGDLVAFDLMPASFTDPKTFFTSQLLDFSRLCNLELKCSSYQFHQLLRRMTCPLSPATVKNLYHEFRRMCRLWRWLKKLRWAGFLFDGNITQPAAAAFGLFCASCPQPGINLPPDWADKPNQTIYGRSFVADGNFKADHVQQKGEDNPLYDGAGMMPNREEYANHLNSVQEVRSVSNLC